MQRTGVSGPGGDLRARGDPAPTVAWPKGSPPLPVKIPARRWRNLIRQTCHRGLVPPKPWRRRRMCSPTEVRAADALRPARDTRNWETLGIDRSVLPVPRCGPAAQTPPLHGTVGNRPLTPSAQLLSLALSRDTEAKFPSVPISLEGHALPQGKRLSSQDPVRLTIPRAPSPQTMDWDQSVADATAH